VGQFLNFFDLLFIPYLVKGGPKGNLSTKDLAKGDLELTYDVRVKSPALQSNSIDPK
jgi:hypothetical protein